MPPAALGSRHTCVTLPQRMSAEQSRHDDRIAPRVDARNSTAGRPVRRLYGGAVGQSPHCLDNLIHESCVALAVRLATRCAAGALRAESGAHLHPQRVTHLRGVGRMGASPGRGNPALCQSTCLKQSLVSPRDCTLSCRSGAYGLFE